MLDLIHKVWGAENCAYNDAYMPKPGGYIRKQERLSFHCNKLCFESHYHENKCQQSFICIQAV